MKSTLFLAFLFLISSDLIAANPPVDGVISIFDGRVEEAIDSAQWRSFLRMVITNQKDESKRIPVQIPGRGPMRLPFVVKEKQGPNTTYYCAETNEWGGKLQIDLRKMTFSKTGKRIYYEGAALNFKGNYLFYAPDMASPKVDRVQWRENKRAVISSFKPGATARQVARLVIQFLLRK